MPSLTVASALSDARAAGVDRLDAQLLLSFCMGRSRTWLLAHDNAALAQDQAETWTMALIRRATGEPLAYVMGEKEFYGMRLAVSSAVLVPRPETETLVDWALAQLHQRSTVGDPPTVLDLGTGSGAIALALKKSHPEAVLVATDASPTALDVAAANGRRLGLDVDWRRGDWWSAIAGGRFGRFDLIVSNPPYIADGDPHLAALGHEPLSALTSGWDGLAAIRTIVAGAPAHLRRAGWLLLEHGYDQADSVRDLLRQAGFRAIDTRLDMAGQSRCSGGVWQD